MVDDEDVDGGFARFELHEWGDPVAFDLRSYRNADDV